MSVSRVVRRRCAIRLTENELIFICNDGMKDGGSWLSYKIPVETFDKYVMSGYRADFNEIILDIDISDVAKCMLGGDTRCKMKLTKKHEATYVQITLFGINIVHDIPVSIVSSNSVSLYIKADIEQRNMLGIWMPPARSVQRILTSMKNMGGKSVTLKLSNNGDLHIQSITDKAKLIVYFSDLHNEDPHPKTTDVEWLCVKLNLRSLHSFYMAFISSGARVLFSILSNHTASITAIIEDSKAQLILGTMVQEDQDDMEE